MNDQFIQGIIFDWNKIDDDSYLKQIEALKDVERLEFQNSINFFVGENGSGKSTQLMDLIQKVERKTMYFLRMIHTPNYAMPSEL